MASDTVPVIQVDTELAPNSNGEESILVNGAGKENDSNGVADSCATPAESTIVKAVLKSACLKRTLQETDEFEQSNENPAKQAKLQSELIPNDSAQDNADISKEIEQTNSTDSNMCMDTKPINSKDDSSNSTKECCAENIQNDEENIVKQTEIQTSSNSTDSKMCMDTEPPISSKDDKSNSTKACGAENIQNDEENIVKQTQIQTNSNSTDSNMCMDTEPISSKDESSNSAKACGAENIQNDEENIVKQTEMHVDNDNADQGAVTCTNGFKKEFSSSSECVTQKAADSALKKCSSVGNIFEKLDCSTLKPLTEKSNLCDNQPSSVTSDLSSNDSLSNGSTNKCNPLSLHNKLKDSFKGLIQAAVKKVESRTDSGDTPTSSSCNSPLDNSKSNTNVADAIITEPTDVDDDTVSKVEEADDTISIILEENISKKADDIVSKLADDINSHSGSENCDNLEESGNVQRNDELLVSEALETSSEAKSKISGDENSAASIASEDLHSIPDANKDDVTPCDKDDSPSLEQKDETVALTLSTEDSSMSSSSNSASNIPEKNISDDSNKVTVDSKDLASSDIESNKETDVVSVPSSFIDQKDSAEDNITQEEEDKLLFDEDPETDLDIDDSILDKSLDEKETDAERLEKSNEMVNGTKCGFIKVSEELVDIDSEKEQDTDIDERSKEKLEEKNSDMDQECAKETINIEDQDKVLETEKVSQEKVTAKEENPSEIMINLKPDSAKEALLDETDNSNHKTDTCSSPMLLNEIPSKVEKRTQSLDEKLISKSSIQSYESSKNDENTPDSHISEKCSIVENSSQRKRSHSNSSLPIAKKSRLADVIGRLSERTGSIETPEPDSSASESSDEENEDIENDDDEDEEEEDEEDDSESIDEDIKENITISVKDLKILLKMRIHYQESAEICALKKQLDDVQQKLIHFQEQAQTLANQARAGASAALKTRSKLARHKAKRVATKDSWAQTEGDYSVPCLSTSKANKDSTPGKATNITPPTSGGRIPSSAKAAMASSNSIHASAAAVINAVVQHSGIPGAATPITLPPPNVGLVPENVVTTVQQQARNTKTASLILQNTKSKSSPAPPTKGTVREMLENQRKTPVGKSGGMTIDLTEEEEGSPAKSGMTQLALVRAQAPQLMQRTGPAALQPTNATALAPGTLLLQGAPTTAGAVVLGQVVAGNNTIRPPTGTLVYASSQPGSLVVPASATLATTTPVRHQLVAVQQSQAAQLVSRPPLPLQTITQQSKSGGKNSSRGPSRPAAASSPDLIMTKCDIPPPGMRHPAPLPMMPSNQSSGQGMKLIPPKPGLKISRVQQGIVLSWNMSVTDNHSQITNYQLFAYQEGSAPPTVNLWKKVGDVKALPLPMACTLTQFQDGNKYHFAVRAMDMHSRVGLFSDPCTIHLTKL